MVLAGGRRLVGRLLTSVSEAFFFVCIAATVILDQVDVIDYR